MYNFQLKTNLNKKGVIFILIIFSISVFALIKLQYTNKPKVFLYAWQRPENLRFLNGSNEGVAYLAGSIVIKDGKISTAPRLQPLNINQTSNTVAVIRIDNIGSLNQLSQEMAKTSAEFITRLCTVSLAGCQVDFDARVSERDFYISLLKQVRSGLDSKIPLSITALLSWCDSNSWISNLLIDEAVPMFYRIGPETGLVRNNITGGSFMKNSKCSRSVAISLDEPLPDKKYLTNRNIYIFNPHSWTNEDYSGIIKLLNAYE